MDEHRQGVATNGTRAESRSEQGWGKDGGPAFPVHEHGGSCLDANGCTHCQFPSHHGMSLRAYFAGLAMQGMLAGRKCELGDVNLADMTESATKFADALIAVLEVK